MKPPQKAISPAQGTRKTWKKKLVKENASISPDSSSYSAKKQGNYQKLIRFVADGDTQGTTEFLEENGLYDVLGEFFLANAERCVKLEIAANFTPCCGGCDD